LRHKCRITPDELAKQAQVAKNTLLRLERDETVPEDYILGRILRFFGSKTQEILPAGADIYDFFVPPTDFGSKIRNFRLRHGLQQKDLAAKLGIHKITLCRYESRSEMPRGISPKHYVKEDEKGISKTNTVILSRLERIIKDRPH